VRSGSPADIFGFGANEEAGGPSHNSDNSDPNTAALPIASLSHLAERLTLVALLYEIKALMFGSLPCFPRLMQAIFGLQG
jgi:hypothetical protein